MKLPTTEQEAAELSMREAVLPPKVQRLRQKLSSKAKEQKRFRFYSLYDKIIDKETLKAAYRQVRANDGAAGVDGIRHRRGNPDTRFAVTYPYCCTLSTLPADGTLVLEAVRGFEPHLAKADT
jgi:hypothetical protein